MDDEKINYARAFIKKALSELRLAKLAIGSGNYAEAIKDAEYVFDKINQFLKEKFDLKLI